MARPKLPTHLVKDTVGVKLTPDVIEELNAIAESVGSRPGTIGRELLLLGLAVYKSSRGSALLSEMMAANYEPAAKALIDDDEAGLLFGLDESPTEIIEKKNRKRR